MKVFCCNCKYCKNSWIERCLHPNSKYTRIDYVSGIKETLFDLCIARNSSGDCKDFEQKVPLLKIIFEWFKK